MTKFHVYFGGVREVETENLPHIREEIEDIMWSKYAIYADEITKIRKIEIEDEDEG